MIRMLDALFAGALAAHVTAPAWSAARMPVTMSAGDGGGPRPPVKSGFYKRPAAAVERGGGFFVPGLEGPRLKLAAGCVLSVALIANHFASSAAAPSQLRSELLGALSIALLFAQAAAQTAVAQEAEQERWRLLATARLEEVEQISPQLSPEQAERALWAGQTALRLSAASAAWIVGAEDEPLLRCGRAPDGVLPSTVEATRALGADRNVALVDASRLGSLGVAPRYASAAVARYGDGLVLVIASERADAFGDAPTLRRVSAMAALEAAVAPPCYS